MILDRLEKEKLDLKKCTRIGFDKVAGVHGGVQRLRNINGKAKFVPCSNHSQNSVHAPAVNASAIAFFRVIERLYTIFSSSIHLWEFLSPYLKIMMKHLVTTRWSVCYKAIRAVKIGFQGMIQALDSLTSASENLQTRVDAQIILLSVENLFISHLFYCEEFLRQINLIEKKLQEPDIALDVCVTHMDSTKVFFNRNRDTLVSESINQGKTKFEEMEILAKNGLEEKESYLGEKEHYACQTLVQEVKINLYECHNRFANKLDAQFVSMSYLKIIFVGLSSQAILKDTEGELERKFKILGSEYVSTLPLEVRLLDF